MLGIAAAAQFMSAPGQSYSVAAFKDPMREGLGLSETDYSLAYGFATVLSACLVPFVGRLVDRFGARILLPLIAAGLGSACFCMARIESLTGLYLAFSFVRSLGQGALTLVSVWLVGEWFQRRRGVATAIAGLGGGISVMTIPLLNHYLIAKYGWDTAWLVLAVLVWGILVLPSIVFVRDRPEDLGLHPDGIDPQASPPVGSHHEAWAMRGPVNTPPEASWTVAEALRNATFWKLLTVPATAGLVGTGLVFHQVALLGSHGLTATSALAMMSVQAGFAIILMFPIGWLTDRIASRHILFGGMLTLALAILLVMRMPATWMVVVYAFLLGLNGSIMRCTATVVWINYYGRLHQGAVRGVVWAVMILASALGPLPLAVSIDRFDSYAPALYLFLSLPLIAAVAVRTARPPCRPTDRPANSGRHPR